MLCGMENETKSKDFIKNLIRWVIILILVTIVFFWKRDLISDAFTQMKAMKLWVIALCTVFSVMYVVFDGIATKLLAGISAWNGIKSAAFCAFYKLVTLGSASGIAEVVYLARCDVPAEKGTGITMIQYAIHKTTVTFLGLVSFIIMLAAGNGQVSKYKIFVLAGSCVSVLIVAAYIILALSEKIAHLTMRLVKCVLKKKTEKAEALCQKIQSFNENGKLLFKDRKSILLTFFTDCAKLLSWYAIPAVIFYGTTGYSVFNSVCLMAIAILLAGVMVTPAGIGTLEYVFSLLFTAVPAPVSAAAVILYRFFSMIVPFFLGIPVVLRGKSSESNATPADNSKGCAGL